MLRFVGGTPALEVQLGVDDSVDHVRGRRPLVADHCTPLRTDWLGTGAKDSAEVADRFVRVILRVLDVKPLKIAHIIDGIKCDIRSGTREGLRNEVTEHFLMEDDRILELGILIESVDVPLSSLSRRVCGVGSAAEVNLSTAGNCDSSGKGHYA